MLLSIESLVSGYGRIQILRDLTLTVDAGEIVALLGRNGVGKTTLVKTLAGIIRAKSGAIKLAGADVTHHAVHECAKLGIGYVPQGRGIFPQLTVRENLQVGVLSNKFSKDRIDEAVALFPAIATRLTARGGDLSGGQQQQLALARALALRPQLLLLDEPSEGIQPSILENIVEILLQIRARTGLAVLLVEQKLDFARALADRAYIMNDGAVAESLNRSELADAEVIERRIVEGAL